MIKFNRDRIYYVNDAEKISKNMLTRSSENFNSRKSVTSEELEDGCNDIYYIDI